jgi:hypothetical protein
MKIPDEVLTLLEDNVKGVNFGKICLEISLHDGKPRFRITKEVSFIPEKTSSGEQKP